MSSFGYCLSTCVSVVAIALSSPMPTPVQLVWNASASAPVGLYAVRPLDVPAVGDLVVVELPATLAELFAERAYLPRGVLLLKRVAALRGQQVCRTGRDVMIDGRFVAAALDRDRHGRELPAWHGCHVIGQGEVFLLSGAVRDSLDGRYFGPIPTTSIMGKAIPLYTEPGGAGQKLSSNFSIGAR